MATTPSASVTGPLVSAAPAGVRGERGQSQGRRGRKDQTIAVCHVGSPRCFRSGPADPRCFRLARRASSRRREGSDENAGKMRETCGVALEVVRSAGKRPLWRPQIGTSSSAALSGSNSSSRFVDPPVDQRLSVALKISPNLDMKPARLRGLPHFRRGVRCSPAYERRYTVGRQQSAEQNWSPRRCGRPRASLPARDMAVSVSGTSPRPGAPPPSPPAAAPQKSRSPF